MEDPLMPKQSAPKVRKRLVRTQGKTYSYWSVDLGVVDGKRKFQNFKTKREAEQQLKDLRTEQGLIGRDAFRLTQHAKKDAAAALQILNGSATLTEAAEFYQAHTAPIGGSQTVAEMFDYYLERKTVAGLSEHHLATLRSRVGRFAQQFGDMQLHEIATQDIEKWFDNRGFRGTNRNNYKLYLSGFFNFAVQAKHLRANPVEGVMKSKAAARRQQPRIFTIAEAQALLNTAMANEPEMTPYFAIGMFAGLRPIAELAALDWGKINWDSKEIFVYSTKTDQARYVDMSDNLIQWLLPCRRKTGLIYYTRCRFEKVVRQAGVKWGIDAMRHTFGSYHLKQHDSVNATILQMGHRGDKTLFANYRAAVSRDIAKEFWNISPRTAAEKTINFPQPVAN